MKLCYPTLYEWNDDGEELRDIIDKGLKAIKGNSKSIELFKGVDPEYIRAFISKVAYHSDETEGYEFVIFRDEKTDEAIGVCLFSSGSPWYNPDKKCLNEECTVAFKRGYGLTHAVAMYMIDQLHNNGYDVIQASSANDCVAKLIENTYNKYGFKQYKSYYKCR